MAEKVKYYTKDNHPKTKPQKVHFEWVTKYVELFDKNGHPYLEEVETYNQHERTQSYKEQCKVDNIIAAAQRGDLSMFRKTEPTYFDATTMPKSFVDAQNLVIRMKDEFKRMPSEVKEKFNNSPEMYVNMMGTKEFDKIMGAYNDKVSKIAKNKEKVADVIPEEGGEK